MPKPTVRADVTREIQLENEIAQAIKLFEADAGRMVIGVIVTRREGAYFEVEVLTLAAE